MLYRLTLSGKGPNFVPAGPEVPWVRRGFLAAWAPVVLYVLLSIVAAFTRTNGGSPAFTPPVLLLTAAAVLLLAQALWTLPLKLHEEIRTHRMTHALLMFGVYPFVALADAWGGREGMSMVMTTLALVASAQALFALRWFAELIHVVPRSWRSTGRLVRSDGGTDSLRKELALLAAAADEVGPLR